MSRGRCHYLVLPQLPDLRTPGSREEAGVRTEEGGEQGRVRRDAEIVRPKHGDTTGDSVFINAGWIDSRQICMKMLQERSILYVNDKQYYLAEIRFGGSV